MQTTINNYKFTLISSKEEIEKIRPIWESMQTHPNADIDHYLYLMTTRTNIIKPYVFLITLEDRPVTLVVGRIESSPFELKVGYKRIYIPIKSLTVISGGIFGDLSDDISKIIFSKIMQPLSRGEVDLIRFNYMNVNTELYKLIASKPGILNRDLLPFTIIHWQMSVPKSIEDFYKSRSSKHRQWLKRMERLLIKEHPDEVTYGYYKNDNELEKVFADLEQIAQKTYQRNINVGFIDSEETRKVYTNLAKKGRFRAYITYIKDKPSAYWIGELYDNIFHLYSTGYDPAFRKYEIGTVLFLKMLEDLCLLGHVRYLDFGFGDAGYKSRFGDVHYQEAIIHIFSNRLNGLKINILRIILVGGQQLVKNILQRYNLLEKMKRKLQKR